MESSAPEAAPDVPAAPAADGQASVASVGGDAQLTVPAEETTTAVEIYDNDTAFEIQTNEEPLEEWGERPPEFDSQMPPVPQTTTAGERLEKAQEATEPPADLEAETELSSPPHVGPEVVGQDAEGVSFNEDTLPARDDDLSLPFDAETEDELSAPLQEEPELSGAVSYDTDALSEPIDDPPLPLEAVTGDELNSPPQAELGRQDADAVSIEVAALSEPIDVAPQTFEGEAEAGPIAPPHVAPELATHDAEAVSLDIGTPSERIEQEPSAAREIERDETVTGQTSVLALGSEPLAGTVESSDFLYRHEPVTAPPEAAPVSQQTSEQPGYEPAAPAEPWTEIARRSARRILRYAAYGLAGYLALTVALIFVYRFVNPPASTLMLYEKLVGAGAEQTWVPLEKISPHLIRAVVVAEDGRFCDHHGIDLAAMRYAILRARGGIPAGASTISMQVTKNLFLWPSRSFLRKLIEIPLTLLMELVWPKSRILEVYLNIAEWGPGVFGAESAARHHFNKPASALGEREAARLAAALPNPIVRDAGGPGPRLVRRAGMIQNRIRLSGDVTFCVRQGR